MMPEIIIQPDGSFLIPRGTVEENSFFRDLLNDLIDEDQKSSLSSFFSATEESEIIFGSSGLCG